MKYLSIIMALALALAGCWGADDIVTGLSDDSISYGNNQNDNDDDDDNSENPPPPSDEPKNNGEFLRFGYLDVPNGDWDWVSFDQVFDGSYTHLLLAVMAPQADGSMLNYDAMIGFTDAYIAEAQANGIKVMGSIGASITPFITYLTIATNSTTRQTFINNILQTMHDKNLDGMDLNFEGQYEGITQAQLDAVNELALDIAQAVKNDDPTNVVTVTLVASYFLPLGFPCSLVNSDLIDYAHHMGYNFAFGTTTAANGPWRAPGETIWPHMEPYSIERSVYGALDYLVEDKGCRVEKLTGGIPFFSAQLNLWNQIRDSANWDSIPMDTDYLEKLPNTNLPYDWMNDPESVAAKVRVYKAFGLGGVMVWQVGQEGSIGDLTEALYNASIE
ncbi:glycoside hydrolase family 18 protein [bacterium]|nr:glycoside hydrolase family 18 protein [bacterium]